MFAHTIYRIEREIKNLKVKTRIIKLLKENIGQYTGDSEVAKDTLIILQKAIKDYIDNSDFIKTEKVNSTHQRTPLGK